ncbi:hypothetical protein [Luteolibacter soli]|uniref:hypothetical protein n=1 Tax=Luteolibacter soli TaxID=3135280 RepID=UPI00311A78D1
MTWREESSVSLRVMTFMMFPVGWICGLGLAMWRNTIQMSEFLAKHRGEQMTEEEFFSVPDGPNVFAGWILLGWLPVVIGFLVTLPLRRRAAERCVNFAD